MIVAVGDVHGQLAELAEKLERVPEDAIVLQVGDFGAHERDIAVLARIKQPFLWITGNHEFFGALPSGRWKPVAHGAVHTLQGKRIGFLGGARSIDCKLRVEGRDWHAELEQPTLRAADELLEAHARKPIDLLVTHSPPVSVVRSLTYGQDESAWGWKPGEWHDFTADLVESVWNLLRCPPLVCGHLHRSAKIGNVRVLGELEIAQIA